MINNLTPKNLGYEEASKTAFKKIINHYHPTAIMVATAGKGTANKIYHIDVFVVYEDGRVETYDIKNNMATNSNGDMCVVVEFQGNNGYKGSLYGRHQYFAIQHDKNVDDIFYIINRNKLLKFTEEKVSDEFVERYGDATYKKYKRSHELKDDVISLIPLDDLFTLGMVNQLYYD